MVTEKPGYVFGSSVCYLNGKIYTIGGVQSKTVDQYDVETDEWKDFFPSLRHCRVAHGVVVHNNKIFVTGGSAKANANFGPGLYEMEYISLDDNNNVLHDWKVAGTMKEGRSFLGSAAIDGKVYSVGGCLSENYSTTEVWNPDTGQFVEVAKSLTKRDSQGLAVINGEIFSIGGYDNISNKYLNCVEKYSPTLDCWSRVPPMNVARRSPGVVNYRNRLYVVGGMGEESDLSTVEVYNPASEEWRLLPTEMKEVNGWCSVALVDKPVRLMATPRVYAKSGADKGFCSIIPIGGGLDLETLDLDDLGSRRESFASSTSGCGSGGTPTEKVTLDWKSTENARTEQRMKKHRREMK